MRNSDVVRPLCRPEHEPLEPSRRRTEQPLGRIRQRAEHDLIVLLERLGQIGIHRVVRLPSRVVQVLMRSARAGVKLDAGVGARGDASDFGVESAGWSERKRRGQVSQGVEVQSKDRDG